MTQQQRNALARLAELLLKAIERRQQATDDTKKGNQR